MGKFKKIEMAELLSGFEVVFERGRIDEYVDVVTSYGDYEPICNFPDDEDCKVFLRYCSQVSSFYMSYVPVDYKGNNSHTNDLSPEGLKRYLEGLRKKVHDLNESVKVDMSYVLDMLQNDLRKELAQLEISKQMMSGNGMIMDRDTKEAFGESGRLASVRIPQLKLAIRLIKDQKEEEL